MALINDIYVFVENESVSRSITASAHPVEAGIDLTDHVSQSPLLLSIAGEIVGSDYEDSVAELERCQKNGTLIEFVGLNIFQNALIAKFDTDHSGEIRCGCRFSMDLQEIRIAESPYKEGSGAVGEQQIEAAPAPAAESVIRTHTVKRGDTLSGIARTYYGNASEFMKIFIANRDKLSDPNLVNVGQVLSIP